MYQSKLFAVLFIYILLSGLPMVLLIKGDEIEGVQMECSSIRDLLTIVPNKQTNIYSTLNSTLVFNQIAVDHGVIDGNLWGLQQHINEFNGYLKVGTEKTGRITIEARLDLNNLEKDKWSVIGYPEIFYGVKPWPPFVSSQMKKSLTTPAKVKELPPILLLIDYAVIEANTGFNLAIDLWLLKEGSLRTPGVDDMEIMIWIFRGGSDWNPSPAGRFIKTIHEEILVDSKPIVLDIDIWYAERVGNGWKYIAFVLRETRNAQEVGLVLNKFIRAAIEIARLSINDYFLYSIELGYEIFYSKEILFRAVINKLLIAISNQEDVKALLGLTERSKKFIAWIVPWGHFFNAEDFHVEYIPGVVLAYDVECGLCTNTLMSWMNISINYIMRFREKNRAIFINLFPEKYHPSWRWRGELSEVKLFEEILNDLKEVIDDGDYVYIGFSELSKCLADETCLGKLLDNYRILRKYFPSARLYYYGTAREDPSILQRLYATGLVDIVGVDIWHYEFKNGKIRIPKDTMRTVEEISISVPKGTYMIGEIGLRLNDRDAHIEPWNKDRPINYEKGIHIRYYEQIIEELSRLSIKPSFIGIWSWNDGIYSINRDPDLTDVIIEHARQTGLIIFPINQCEKGAITEKGGDDFFSSFCFMAMIVTIALLSILVFILYEKRH